MIQSWGQVLLLTIALKFSDSSFRTLISYFCIMVSLSALPSELLLTICDHIDPEDFLSFELLNRRIYASVEPARRRHHELWTRYNSLRDKGNSSPWFWYNVLHSLIDGWLGAKYVRHLKINRPPKIYLAWLDRRGNRDDFMVEWDYEEHKEVLISAPGRRLAGSSHEEIASAMFETNIHLLEEAVKTEAWWPISESVRGFNALGENNLLLALLASRLPNIRALKFPGSSSSLGYLKDAALYAATRPCSSNPPLNFMTRLTEIDLIDPNHLYDTKEFLSIDMVSIFISLPSIKTFAAAKIAASEDFIRIRNLPAPRVTGLTLLQQDIPPDTLCALLDGCNNLNTVHLVTKTNNIRPKFDDRHAIEFLLRIAANTLESLTLHAEPHYATTLPHLRSHKSLAAFTCLKTLSISFDCFSLPYSPSPSSSPHPSPAIKLADLLPSSLSSLKILGLRYRARLASDIHDLLMSPNARSRLPSLTHLEVGGWLDPSDRVPMRRTWNARNIYACGGGDNERDVLLTAANTAPLTRLPPEPGIEWGSMWWGMDSAAFV